MMVLRAHLYDCWSLVVMPTCVSAECVCPSLSGWGEAQVRKKKGKAMTSCSYAFPETDSTQHTHPHSHCNTVKYYGCVTSTRTLSCLSFSVALSFKVDLDLLFFWRQGFVVTLQMKIIHSTSRTTCGTVGTHWSLGTAGQQSGSWPWLPSRSVLHHPLYHYTITKIKY